VSVVTDSCLYSCCTPIMFW